jgi:hypothetical protein
MQNRKKKNREETKRTVCPEMGPNLPKNIAIHEEILEIVMFQNIDCTFILLLNCIFINPHQNKGFYFGMQYR